MNPSDFVMPWPNLLISSVLLIIACWVLYWIFIKDFKEEEEDDDIAEHKD